MCILLIPLILYVLLMNSSIYIYMLIFILVSGTVALANVGQHFWNSVWALFTGFALLYFREYLYIFRFLIVGTSVNNLNSC
jgi:hypothetical protein